MQHGVSCQILCDGPICTGWKWKHIPTYGAAWLQTSVAVCTPAEVELQRGTGPPTTTLLPSSCCLMLLCGARSGLSSGLSSSLPTDQLLMPSPQGHTDKFSHSPRAQLFPHLKALATNNLLIGSPPGPPTTFSESAAVQKVGGHRFTWVSAPPRYRSAS